MTPSTPAATPITRYPRDLRGHGHHPPAAPGACYERGPTGEGYRIRERAHRAVAFLREQTDKRLLLAGATAAAVGSQSWPRRGSNKTLHNAGLSLSLQSAPPSSG